MSVSFYPAPDGPLPARQYEMLQFIDAAIANGHPFPSEQDLSVVMGWKSKVSAYDCLCRLRWRGFVRLGKHGEPRWIRTDKKQTD